MDFNFRKNLEKCDMIIQPPDSIQTNKYIFRIGSHQDYLPIDWYNAYLFFDLDITKGDNTKFTAGTRIALASDSGSLINSIKFESDSRQIFYVNDINYAIVIKNLMEMSKEYINSVGNKSFIYPDTIDGTNITKYTVDSTTNAMETENADYNSSYHKRANLTRTGVQTIMPLKSIEYFSSLRDVLLPPTKIELSIDIESDVNLLYKDTAVADGKVTIKNIYLCYEKLTLSPANKLLYTQYLSKQQIIKFYRENIFRLTSLKNVENDVILYETAQKPRHLFIWFSDTANRSLQKYDSFEINTSDDNIINAYIVINDNRHIPITPFNCVTQPIIPYNELLKYMTKNNQRESNFIDYELFKTKYMILYFNINDNITESLRDSFCKIQFKYILKSEPTNEYTVYSLLLYEDQYKISLINGKSEIIK